VTIQASSASSTAAVGAVTTLISVRGTDHSASSNVLVDEFYQLHNDAAGVAAQAPFHAVLGTCATPATVAKALGGTICVIDASDPSTNVRGNATGSQQTTAAYKTANWWVHTGASGSQYIDGTTSTYDKLSISFGAASALVNATSAVISMPDIHARTESLAAYAGITQTDGILTYAGESRTFTITLKNTGSPTATIKSGYSIKVATSIADVLGNVTTSTAYYPVTSAAGGGTASWTTTCPADDSALTSTYATAIEHRVSMGALLDADGLPTGVTVSPMDDDFVLAPASGAFDADATTYSMGLANGQTAGTVGLTCQDTTRAYTGGGSAATHSNETLAVSSNNYATSTSGSLTSITATAYDQYGAGVAGASVQFTRVSTPTTGGTTTTANVATLTTSANGTASLSTVVCAAGASVDAREVETAWSVTDPGNNTLEMDAITAAVPNALAVEGTSIYCTSAGADGVHEQLADAAQVTTLTFNDRQSDYTAGTLTLTVANNTAGTSASTAAMPRGHLATVANNSGGALAEGAIEGLANVPASNIASTSSGDGNQVLTITFPAATGSWTVSVVENSLVVSATPVTLVIANGTPGVPATTFDFIDDDAASNTVITKKTTVGASAAGAASTTRIYYNTWVYDSGDVFSQDATDDDIATTITGITEAAFETVNAAINDLTSDYTISYRTGATTSGISYFIAGT